MVLSVVSLIIVRGKILDNVQLMGEEVAEHLLVKENEKIENYDFFIFTIKLYYNTNIVYHFFFFCQL